MMGMAEVTTLQSQGIGKLKLSPSLEAESSSLADSSKMACSDGQPLSSSRAIDSGCQIGQ
jgi:hypothetical protein